MMDASSTCSMSGCDGAAPDWIFCKFHDQMARDMMQKHGAPLDSLSREEVEMGYTWLTFRISVMINKDEGKGMAHAMDVLLEHDKFLLAHLALRGKP